MNALHLSIHRGRALCLAVALSISSPATAAPVSVPVPEPAVWARTDTASLSSDPPVVLVMDAASGGGGTPPPSGPGDTPGEPPADSETPGDPPAGSNPPAGTDPPGTGNDSENTEAARLREIEENTDRVIARLEGIRRECQEFSARSSAYNLASAYQGVDAGDVRTVAPTAVTATRSFLSSGDAHYGAAAETLTARQRRLRQRLQTRTAARVGDPVRISDGAFLFTVPLPRLRHWGLTVDLSLTYDSARRASSPLGRGWWWTPAERAVPGVDALPAMETVLEDQRDRLAALTTELDHTMALAFPGVGDWRAVHDTSPLLELDSEWGDQIALLEELRAELDALQQDAADLGTIAVGILASLEETNATVDAVIAGLRDDRARIAGASSLLNAAAEGLSALGDAELVLQRETQRYADIRRRILAERELQFPAVPPGFDPDELGVGSGLLTYFDDAGVPHVFSGDGSSTTLPWWTAVPDERGYRIDTPHSVRFFDRAGRLVRISDRQGHELRFRRDTIGRPVAITDESDVERASFRWEENRCTIQTAGVAPTSVEFGGDGSSRLVHAVRGPRGTITFGYRDTLMTRIDRDGDRITRVEWSSGTPSVHRVVGATGGVESLESGTDGRRTFTDGDGLPTTYRIENGRAVRVEFPSGRVRVSTWDSRGRLVETTDSDGGGHTRQYDDRGALAEVRWPDGRWSRLERDSVGRIVRQTDDTGTVAAFAYREDGALVAFTASDGRHYRIDREDDRHLRIIEGTTVLWTIALDQRGRPAMIQRMDGREERRVYDDAGRLERRTIDGVVVERRRYDDAGGVVEIARRGERYQIGYGVGHRPVEVARNGEEPRRISYDAAGREVRVAFADGRVSETRWTPGGRVAEQRLPDGRTVAFQRDGAGRVVAIRSAPDGMWWRFTYDDSGRLMTRRGRIGGETHLVYDAAGTHVGYRFPDGSGIERYTYPGGRFRLIAPDGSTVTGEVDAAGRIRELVESRGVRTTIRRGDGVTEIMRNGGLVRRERRDALGRPISVVYPDGTSERWTYEEHGRRVTFTDRRGGIHLAEYDHEGRPLLQRAADGFLRSLAYGENSITETIAGHQTVITRFDAEGLARSVTTSSGTMERSPRDTDGGYRIVVRNPAGALLRELTFDGRDRLLDLVDGSVGHVYHAGYGSATNTTRRLLGVTEWSVVAAEGTHETVRDSAGDAWTVRRNGIGLTVEITGPGGAVNGIAWQAARIPREIRTMPTPGAEFREIVDLLPGTLRRRDGENREIASIAWNPAENTANVHSNGVTRRIVTGPYGQILRESIVQEGGPPVTVARSVDSAGRVQATTTDGGTAVPLRFSEVAHRGDRRGFQSTVNGMRFTAVAERGTLSVSVVDDDGRRTLLRSNGTSTAVVGAAEVGWRTWNGGGASVGTVETLLAGGDRRVLDSLVIVRDAAGRELAEQRLDGTTQLFTYTDSGHLATASAVDGGVVRPTAPDIARLLTAAWRGAAVSVTPPAPPARTLQRPVPDPAAGLPVERDSIGRMIRIGDTRIAYDDTSGAPRTVSEGERAWDIVRDASGAPLRITHRPSGRTWTSATVAGSLAGVPVALRAWRLSEVPPATDVPRFAPASPRAPDATGHAPADRTCVEVRLDGRTIAVVDAETVTLPFVDTRGTSRGAAIVDRVTGTTTYRRGGETSAVAAFSRPAEPLFPAAVPYSSLVYGMWRLGDLRALVGTHRAYLPDIGSFTSRDPALHHHEWFRYAAGDPVNLTDATGTQFVGARVGLSDVQQDRAWSNQHLGTGGSYTIGSAGCVLTAISNMVNTVAGRRISDPGNLNRWAQDGYFRDANLLAASDAASILEAATGRVVRHISVDPREVNMGRIAAYLSEDPTQEYTATARLSTYHTQPDGQIETYEHSVNLAGFDSTGAPMIVDTSTRGRTALAPREEVRRYDIYAYSRCESY